MRLLKHHQIKQQELKLLETCGHSLAEYGEATSTIQVPSNYKNMIDWKTINKYQIKWLRNTGSDCNSNLKAFINILLHKIYSVNIEQSLLILLKSVFYNPELDLSVIDGHSMVGLSSCQMKKLVVEFFYLLNYSFFDDKIQSKLNKYPIIMNIFVLFLRKLLSNLNISQALDYKNQLPTLKVYLLLSSFFKLDLQIHEDSFIFPEMHMLIMKNQLSQIHFGKYAECSSQVPSIIKSNSSLIETSSELRNQQFPNNSTIISKTRFFPKKEMNKKTEVFLNQSTKTDQSLKSIKQTGIKKTKSLKEYSKRKYSNIQTGIVAKVGSTYDLTQDSKIDCNCKAKKQTNLSLQSNLYEVNIKFVPSDTSPHSNSTSLSKRGDFLINSKGITYEHYEVRRTENKFIKNFFLSKKKLQTLKAKHQSIKTANNDNSKQEIKTNPQSIYRPISSYPHSSTHFSELKSRHIQDHAKKGPYFSESLISQPISPANRQQKTLRLYERYRNSAFNPMCSHRVN